MLWSQTLLNSCDVSSRSDFFFFWLTVHVLGTSISCLPRGQADGADRAAFFYVCVLTESSLKLHPQGYGANSGPLIGDWVPRIQSRF